MNDLINKNEKLMTFENKNFGTIRTVDINGIAYFVGKDVATILGYSNQNEAIQEHVDTEDKLNSKTLSSFNLDLGQRGGWLINESGLYSLILSSKLPKAKDFKRWVTSEVLPSIRKNGGYIANQENLTPEQIVANALIVAQNIITQKDKQITEMKPKAEFYDDVTGSDDAIGMAEVAKILNLGIGRNKIFELLRKTYILQQNNTPYQKYVDLGYFRIIESKYTLPDGTTKISLKTVVFQKGLDFLRKTLKKYAA